MEIILLQDFPQLGFIGEQHHVKKGYARNFLIPRGIAIESSSRNAKQLSHHMAQINVRKAKAKDEAQAIANRLQQVTIQFKLKFGESGKSFGSIGTRDIEAALVKEGFPINKKQLALGEPLRGAGDFQVTVKLHSEVQARVKVQVIAERIVEAQPKDEDKKDARGRRRREKAEGEEAAGEEETREAAEGDEAES